MKRKAIFLILLVCTVHASFSQAILQGTIKSETGEPISGAAIRLLNTANGTVSNSAGQFTFNGLPAGTYTIFSSAGGYEDAYQKLVIENGLNTVQLEQIKTTNSLEAVIVSSQKSEEILQQTPVSITSLSAQKVHDYRLWNIEDLTAVASNLFTSHPGDNRNVTSIRGITSTSYDPAVATYVDGVNQFSLDTYIPQLFDVERIEILKGPQGFLYGRNAMGGVINIITKKPGNTLNGFASASAGNYGLQRYSAGLRVPLVKDKLFFGIAGLYNRTNGFYTNTFNNSDYDKKSSAVGNYYLRYTPSTSWSFTLNAKHSHNRNNGAFPLVFGVEEAFKNPYQLNQNAITKMIDNVFNTSLSVNHYGRAVQLSSQTAYQSNHRYYTDPIDADFSPLDAMTIINNYGDEWNKVKVVTQEINLQSAAANNSPVKWLVGTYLFRQVNPVKQTTRFGDDAQLLGAADKNFSLINTSRTKGTGAALYGQLQYSISQKLVLTGGLRYDWEKRKHQVLGEYQKDPDPDPIFAYRSDTSATANFSALSPRLILAFYPTEKGMLYGSYNRGFRAGGLTSLSSDPSQPALYPFRPEFSNNIEAGWKQTSSNRRMIINLALFYSFVRDVQVPTLVLPDAVTITRNTGSLVSKGVEAELRYLLSKGFSIDYNFGYTHAEYDQLRLSQNGNETNLKGKRQIFTPTVTSLLAVQYTKELGKSNLTLIARGEWKYLGTQYFDLTNSIKQTPYHLLNTRMGIAYKKTELSFWGRNLANKQYIGYAYDFGAVHLCEPFTYGTSLSVNF
ncbi:MAG TPA: TonB-dependent receptor [Flavisolibacter sp.]|nr:TonB-dependent receptor [Flavisolibacter sp.]